MSKIGAVSLFLAGALTAGVPIALAQAKDVKPGEAKIWSENYQSPAIRSVEVDGACNAIGCPTRVSYLAAPKPEDVETVGSTPVQWQEMIHVPPQAMVDMVSASCVSDDSKRPKAFGVELESCPAK